MNRLAPEKPIPDSPTLDAAHDRCWNCGRYPYQMVAGRRLCMCGCGWSVRHGIDPEAERAKREFRDRTFALTTYGIELIDFTRPDAPGSPA